MVNINELLNEALSQRTCYVRPVAAVIETADGCYVSGWNGAPSGIEHPECSRKGYRSGERMDLCIGVHAERRAISHASRDGIATKDGTIYLSGWFPCADCAKSIIEAGIVRLVTPDEVYVDKERSELLPSLQRQCYNFEMAEKLFREAGVEIVVDPSIGHGESRPAQL